MIRLETALLDDMTVEQGKKGTEGPHRTNKEQLPECLKAFSVQGTVGGPTLHRTVLLGGATGPQHAALLPLDLQRAQALLPVLRPVTGHGAGHRRIAAAAPVLRLWGVLMERGGGR